MTILLRRQFFERLFERAIYWINFNYYSLDTSINLIALICCAMIYLTILIPGPSCSKLDSANPRLASNSIALS